MNAHVAPPPLVLPSVCPHDCPSTCALDVEVHPGNRIGRVRGAADNSYTDGVICAKVARYAERVHHPDRLLKSFVRRGAKGGGDWMEASNEAALDLIAEKFLAAEARHGTEAIWPYFYAGTMGLVMRDGINRLRHAKKYSGQYSTICTTLAWTGYIAGTGRLAGPDPREMALSDCVVIWGTNPVHTQVNVMAHAVKGRRVRGTKIVAVDIYMNDTMKQADMALLVKPGTDAALACAVMHVAFRDGHADRAYLASHASGVAELEAHLKTRTPEWASAITGLTVAEIEAFAKLVGTTPKTYFRLGYGFARQRNGAIAMHAAASVATVLGSWQREGGGAFHNNGAIFGWKKTLIEGLDLIDRNIRVLDQSRVGPILDGDADALKGGPPVTAMLIQNTNPVSVAPEQERVKRGFAREDLFVAVHEQFMTETAAMADVVLPATMFLEHDDVYQAGGQQHILWGGKLVDPPGECLTNHEVIVGLSKRLGIEHPANAMTPKEIVDWTLKASNRGDVETLIANKWLDCQPDFDTAHFTRGFGHRDGRFALMVDWGKVPVPKPELMGPWADAPRLPDQWNVIETADAAHPFRLATSPARSFLNSSFTETPSSKKKEGRPEVMIHPDDAAVHGIADGAKVRLGNARGVVTLHARHFDGVRRGVLIAEAIWPNAAHEDGKGINTLTGADAAAPVGGAAFHDNRAWIRLA
jgi:anaerobic selenocysteine-containing dehydrogenase